MREEVEKPPLRFGLYVCEFELHSATHAAVKDSTMCVFSASAAHNDHRDLSADRCHIRVNEVYVYGEAWWAA